VLKGPATGLYGIGSAGGVINLVEKKPLRQEAYEIKATLGQWDNHGIMFDATSALSENTAYRLVGNVEKSDGYRGLSSARNELYGSLLFDITDSQQLVTSVAYIDDENQVDSIGHPYVFLTAIASMANKGPSAAMHYQTTQRAKGFS
jgi:outer membrane receptor for ferric coprogen and ferric-rhodotorulic acid